MINSKCTGLFNNFLNISCCNIVLRSRKLSLKNFTSTEFSSFLSVQGWNGALKMCEALQSQFSYLFENFARHVTLPTWSYFHHFICITIWRKFLLAFLLWDLLGAPRKFDFQNSVVHKGSYYSLYIIDVKSRYKRIQF